MLCFGVLMVFHSGGTAHSLAFVSVQLLVRRFEKLPQEFLEDTLSNPPRERYGDLRW